MKLAIFVYVMFFGLILAQMDLSTPGGNSVLITVYSDPAGAQIYVSDTYIGLAPIQVRINANTPTTFRAIIPNSQYENHIGTYTFGSDDSILLAMTLFGEPTSNVIGPLDSNNPENSSATIQGQPVRAYRDLYFGMSAYEFFTAIDNDSTITSRGSLSYDVVINGVGFVMLPDFDDNLRLVRLLFETDKVRSGSYETEVRSVVSGLTSFLTRAYGQPTSQISPPFSYQLQRPVHVTTIWEQPSEDKTVLIGIVNESGEYYVRLVILSDSLFEAWRDREASDF